jgi:hypothetical protein
LFQAPRNEGSQNKPGTSPGFLLAVSGSACQQRASGSGVQAHGLSHGLNSNTPCQFKKNRHNCRQQQVKGKPIEK